MPCVAGNGAQMGKKGYVRHACGKLECILGGDRPLRHDLFGPLRCLVDVPDTVESAALVRDLSGSLVEHDNARPGELMPALRTSLDSGGHHRRTSEASMVRVGICKCRLARIRKLLGFEILDLLAKVAAGPFTGGEEAAGAVPC